MSEQNVEIVRRFLVVDLDEALTYADPGIVWNPVEESSAQGHDAVRASTVRWKDEWDDYELIPEELADVGDRVVATVRLRGRGRRSGIETDARFYEVHTLRDGKIVRMDQFTERSEALAAAGLQEPAMSSESVELVRRSFEAFARGDFDRAFSAYAPSIEWCTAADEPDQQVFRGVAGLRSLVGSLEDSWVDRFDGVMEFEGFLERGDWVVVPWSARVRGRGSGIELEITETYAVRVQGTKIVRVDEYRTKAQALEAVEAREGPTRSRATPST